METKTNKPQQFLSFFLVLFLLASQLAVFRFVSSVNASVSSGWYYSGWDYRKEHNLTSSSAVADYQIKFEVYNTTGTDSGNSVYLGSNVQADFDDVRWTWYNTSSNSEVECDYWIESYSSNHATFWVEVPSIPSSGNSTIYIYYGNSTATTTSNGDNTFLFFDPFDSFDTDVWSGDTGAYSASNGILSCSSSGAQIFLSPTYSDHAIRVRFRGTDATSARAGILARTDGTAESEQYRFRTRVNDNDDCGIGVYEAGVVDEWLSTVSYTFDTNVWYVSEFRLYGTSLKGYINDVEQTSVTDNRFSSGQAGWRTYTNAGFDLDWYLIRKYVDPEPTHGSWGTEETQEEVENSITQNSPSEGATETQWTVDFYYTVTYYDTPKNACLRIFNSTDGSLLATVWNNTALQNNTSVNYGSYTFSVEQTYKWDCIYYNNTGSSWQSSGNWTLTVDVPPRYQNVGQNATSIDVGGTIKLYAQGYDGIGLDWAWLSTNETGTWKNYTKSLIENVRRTGSPITSQDQFTWNGTHIVEDHDLLTDSAHYVEAVSAKYSADSDWTAAGGVSIAKDGDIWYIALRQRAGTGERGLEWQIYNSTDLSTWTLEWGLNRTDVTNQPSAGISSIEAVSLRKYSGTFYLYISVLIGTYNWNIYYVNSSTISGLKTQLENFNNWVEIVADGGSNDGENYAREKDPRVFEYDGTYYLAYRHQDGGDYSTRRVLLLNSSTPTFSSYSLVANLTEPYEEAYGATSAQTNPNVLFFDESSNQFIFWCTYTESGNVYWSFVGCNSSDMTSWHNLDRKLISTSYPTNAHARYADMYTFDSQREIWVMEWDDDEDGHDHDVFVWNYSDDPQGQTENTTGQVYGSPLDMDDVADTWTWSNFTWTNSSIPAGTTIQWRIYYNDTHGNVNATEIQSFTVTVEEYSHTFTEILSPSAILNQWQEHFRIWIETVYPSTTINLWQEISYTYTQTITATETVTYYQEHIRLMQESLSPTETMEYAGEGVFTFTQTITPSETVTYLQEQQYILTETAAPTASFEHWIEGINVFTETFIETLSSSATVYYWVEMSHTLIETFNPQTLLETAGEIVYVLTETITGTVQHEIAQELLQTIFETLKPTTVFNYAKELAETFITNIETLNLQDLVSKTVKSVATYATTGYVWAVIFVVAFIFGLPLTLILIKVRK